MTTPTPQTTITINGWTGDFDIAVNLMDDDIRNRVHADLAPCSPQQFCDAYAVLDADFVVN